MWFLLLLLHGVKAVVAAQCRQGSTFSEAVVSPDVESRIVWVPGVASLPQCVAACCDLPGYDLAWLFQGRCYALCCQQSANCRPRERPGANSVLAFLRRESPQPLMLQSLLRSDTNGGRWRSPSRPSEAPGNLEDLKELKDVVLLNRPQQDLTDPGTLKYSEGNQEETNHNSDATKDQPPLRGGGDKSNQSETGVGSGGDRFNQSETVQGQGRVPTASGVFQNGAGGNISQGSADGTTKPADPDTQETPESPQNPDLKSPDQLQEETGSAQHVVTSLPDHVPPHQPVSASTHTGSSVLLDGRGGVGSRWDAVSGPPGLTLEGADQGVAMATGRDREGMTDGASLMARVQEAGTLPPVAHASGSHTLTLPNNSLVLRGSVTNGDQTEVHFLWVRDRQSPAAGDVLYGSDSQASLYLANLVQGTYVFQLRVTDAQGRSSTAAATVEVRPEPGGGEEVELEMLVPVSEVSVAQRDTVVRQLAALLHVLDRDIRVRRLQGRSQLSTVLRFSVRDPAGSMSGSRLVVLLRNQLIGGRSDYLLFRVLQVDTVSCPLLCSGRGQCNPLTKECTCDPFWTENPIRRYLGDGESNCEWRLLYVILTSFTVAVFILSASWTFICCCRRGTRTTVRNKTRYTILDNMDEQEQVELRPKFSIKHRSTEHNSSLMMSESELDSDRENQLQSGPTCSQQEPDSLPNQLQWKRLWLTDGYPESFWDGSALPVRSTVKSEGLHYPEILYCEVSKLNQCTKTNC